MAFNAALDHALTNKYMAIYMEGDAKFVIKPLMEDKWQ